MLINSYGPPFFPKTYTGLPALNEPSPLPCSSLGELIVDIFHIFAIDILELSFEIMELTLQVEQISGA